MLTDLRHALRDFARRPGWTAAVVLTLAAAIGANTTLFAYVASIVWPVANAPEPDRVVAFGGSGSADDPSYLVTSGPDFEDYHAENNVFSALAASTPYLASLIREDGTTFQALAEEVRGEYFEILGARALAGRLLVPSDDDVVVLGYRFWQRAFQGNTDAVGATVKLEARDPVTVVGILGEGFADAGGAQASFYRPAEKHPEDPEAGRDMAWLSGVGRLRDGVTPAQARSAMQELGRVLDQRHPRDTPRLVDVRPIRTAASLFKEEDSRMQAQSKVLMAAVALFLALACANVANLLLTRAVGRRRETAVRLALGAGRWPLARRVLVECLLLAAAGAAAGVALGAAGSRLLDGYFATKTVGFTDVTFVAVRFDQRAALFGALAALGTACLFGLAPLVETWRRDLRGLKSRGEAAGGREGHWRRILVVIQVALSCALLLAAGLLGRTLVKLQEVDPGFDGENLYVASFHMPRLPGVDAGEVYGRLSERVRGLPGVEKTGQTLMAPLAGRLSNTVNVTVDGQEVTTYRRTVTGDFHDALGVELLAGRFFNEHDVPDAPVAVLVNEAFARAAGSGTSLAGRSFVLTAGSHHRGKTATVVGVVGNTHPKYLHEAPKPTYYMAMSQRPRPAAWTILMIRTAPGAVHPGPAIAKIVRDDFEYVALTEMMPFSEQVSRNTSEQRLSADLSLAVAALGLLLAVVGLGSVLGYAVSCRKPEIGLRMALGATAENVRAMVAGEAARMVAAGLLLGGAGAFALGRLLESQLYGLVGMTDVPTLVTVPAVLVAAALAASWLPATRAASVDPAAALRDE